MATGDSKAQERCFAHDEMLEQISRVSERTEDLHKTYQGKLEEHSAILVELKTTMNHTNQLLEEMNKTIFRGNGKKSLVGMVDEHEGFIQEARQTIRENRLATRNSIFSTVGGIVAFCVCNILLLGVCHKLGIF